MFFLTSNNFKMPYIPSQMIASINNKENGNFQMLLLDICKTSTGEFVPWSGELPVCRTTRNNLLASGCGSQSWTSNSSMDTKSKSARSSQSLISERKWIPNLKSLWWNFLVLRRPLIKFVFFPLDFFLEFPTDETSWFWHNPGLGWHSKGLIPCFSRPTKGH